VRVAGDDREARAEMLARIARDCDAPAGADHRQAAGAYRADADPERAPPRAAGACRRPRERAAEPRPARGAT
jgi:hypothetical protein